MKNIYHGLFLFLITNTLSAGIGTRGTGVGTRGTALNSDQRGIGTRGTNYAPTTSDDLFNLNSSQSAEIPYRRIFQNDALVLNAVLSKYLSSKQQSFDDHPNQNAILFNFETWATTHAGEILASLEKTHWKVIEDEDSLEKRLNFNLQEETNTIEITSSPSGLDQSLHSGMISQTLTQFLIYAGAPFSYEEIYIEILPFEKDIVQSRSSLITH